MKFWSQCIILRKQETILLPEIIYCDLNLNVSFPRDDINCGLNSIYGSLGIINYGLNLISFPENYYLRAQDKCVVSR